MDNYFTGLHDFIRNSAERYPDKPAVICTNTVYTYRQIYKKSRLAANYMIDAGLRRGDRVIICLGNSINTVICFWATLLTGAVVSIVNPDVEIDKLKYILDDSGASILSCLDKHYCCLQDDWLPASGIKEIILESDADINHGATTFNRIFQRENDRDLKPAILDIDLASIIYTSGSTGEQKGVTLSHRNMLSAISAINQYLSHRHNDVIISVLPMSFDYGLYQMIMSFSVGATLILEKNFIWPTQILKKISKYNATVLPVVPTMVPLLYKHLHHFNYDLSSIRCITSTGAALSVKHIEMLKTMFISSEIFSMYGLTECKRCTYLPPSLIDSKPNSVGIAIPNTELWLIDDNGNRLGPNKVGQLVIRGATIMQGYWNKDVETAKKLKDGPLPGEKVLYTGDYCWLDDDGYLYFHGRMDEMIKSRGIKVSPKEIEDTLLSIDGISEVAVIGIKDLELGVAIHAYVAVIRDCSVDEIDKLCKKLLLPEKQPKYITILKNVPKTDNGKVDKLYLKELSLKNRDLVEGVV